MATLSTHHLARACAPLLAAALVSVAPGRAVAVPAPEAFHVPAPVVRTLPNGLRVAVFSRPRLPIVQMQLLVPAGVAQEAAATPGAASATAQLLRAGTSSRSADGFAADVDRLGGTIVGGATRDLSTIGGTFLAADFEAGLELLADAVVNPIFPVEEIERFRAQTAGALLQSRQDPASLADEWLWTLAFEGHPYGRRIQGSLETLIRLDREAVRAFHRDFYRPDRAVLAIAGDVDPERAFTAAADRFGAWAGHAAATPALPVPASPASVVPRIRIVDRPGQAQSEIRIGLPAPARGEPDALSLSLANQVLGGGGFSSRLTQALRVDDGLSYDVRSTYTALRDGGLVTLRTVARNDSVVTLVARMRDQLARIASQPPTEAEIVAARRFLQNSYPLQFETLGALLSQWQVADFLGLPAGTLEHYVESVGAVTGPEVARASERWLDPRHMVVVVVGPAVALKGSLEALGQVEVVSPDVRVEAPVSAPATPEQVKRGREVLDQLLAAHGGLERLRRVKDSTIRGEMTLSLGGNDVTLPMEQVRKDPFRMRFVSRIALVENGQILNGRRGWLFSVSGDSLAVSEADSIGIEGMRTAFGSDIVHLLLAAADSTTEVIWRGATDSDGKDADVLDVTLAPPAGDAPERRRLHVDAKDHRLVAVEFSESQVRPGTFAARRAFRDYRAVGGVQWPFHEERTLHGARAMTLMVQTVTLDRSLADELFERPRPPGEDRPRR
jgi:zinc protease